jgi:hypothetical protein
MELKEVTSEESADFTGAIEKSQFDISIVKF